MVEIKQILAWIILKKYSEGESKDSYTQKQRMKTSVATEKLIESKSWDEETKELYNTLGQMWNQYPGSFNSSILPSLIINYLK